MFVFLKTLSPLSSYPCLQLHFCTRRPVVEVKPRVLLPSLTTVSLSARSARTPPLSGSVSPAGHSTVAGLLICISLWHNLWPTILQMNTGMLPPMGWSTRRRQSHILFAWRPMSSVSSAMTVMSLSSMTQLISRFSLFQRLNSLSNSTLIWSAGTWRVSEPFFFRENWRMFKKEQALEGIYHMN